MNLFHLRYFVKLAHVKHYTRAAEQLCITQPSLSHAIAQLEKELGVPLFEKSGRNTALTRFGEEFLICAQQSLSVLDAGISSLQRSARGEGLIRLGLLRTLGTEFIPEMAAEFLRQNEGRDIQFTFHTGVTGQLLEGLSAGNFDLIFCSRPPEELHFTAEAVKSQKMVVIVPPDHPLAAHACVTPQDLISYPFIRFSPGSGLREVVDRLFDKLQERPRVVCETEEDQVIAGLVAQGFGISVVPYMDLLLKLGLKILPIDADGFKREFFMVHDSRIFMPPVAGRFREFVLERGMRR